MASAATPIVTRTSTGGAPCPAATPSLLLSHTKLDDQNTCENDHTNDPSMVDLRAEALKNRLAKGDSAKMFLAIACPLH